MEKNTQILDAIKIANDEYSKSLKAFKEVEKEYFRVRDETQCKLIDLQVALTKHKMTTGNRYVVNIGKREYDVIDVGREGNKYKISYSVKSGEIKSVLREYGPRFVPVVTGNEKYEI